MKPLLPASQKEKAIFFRRILLAGCFILLGFGLLFSRYAYLEINEHDKFRTQSDNNRIKLLSSPPSRGYIYDRNGYLLADNHPVFTAVLMPDEVENPELTLNLLTPILNLTTEDITSVLDRLKQKSKPDDPIAIKIDLTQEQLARFSERKPFFKGVSIQTKLTRTYPYGELFAHVIGYVGRINDKDAKVIDKQRYAGTDLIGKIGIEKYYENLLHGEPGYQSVETNAHGDILRKLDSVPPSAGNDIYLTLDYGLQKIAHEQLAGRRGAIVAIDPNNGDVLAFVSNPSYDPNPFIAGISYKDYNQLRENPDMPLYNRALQGMYPPGSTIKPFEGLGGIHYGLVNWQTSIYDPGYFTLPGDSHRFRDWKKSGHGIVNLEKAVMESCDTYYYNLAYRMGIERLHNWMIQFGFGKDTGIDLPNEKSGVMPSPQWKMNTYGKKWLPGETISVSIGQGYFLATPLQVAVATAITANKGQHITPHLLKRSTGAVDVTPIDKPDGEIAFNGTKADWQRMHNAMVGVIERGTARLLKKGLVGYKIAGKTGTAQVKSIAQGKTYDERKLDKRHWDHAWFIGFAPADNPKVAVSVIVENGRHGGSTAGPVARAIFDYVVHRMEQDPILPPSRDELAAIRQQKGLKKQTEVHN